jgi:hypothetical protein
MVNDEECEMKAALMFWMNRSRMAAVQFGPYVVVALLIPGGTLIAALAWLYRHLKPAQARS